MEKWLSYYYSVWDGYSCTRTGFSYPPCKVDEISGIIQKFR